MQEVEIDGVTLAYAEAGTGRALVCVHGNFASKRWFTEQLSAPPPGWRVVALDLPNFGDSDALPGDISIDAYGRSLEGFLDALDLADPVLLGHSLGGAVVQSLAVRAPERLAGLALVASAPPDGLVTPEESYRYLELFKTNRALLAQSLAATMPTRKPAYFEAIVDDAFRMNRRAFTGNARALERYDYSEALGAVRCPVLVLRGERDYLISEAAARRTAAAFGSARLELLRNVGHSPQLEAPEAFATLITAFLRSLPKP